MMMMITVMMVMVMIIIIVVFAVLVLYFIFLLSSQLACSQQFLDRDLITTTFNDNDNCTERLKL